jgi:WD40 repeat protein
MKENNLGSNICSACWFPGKAPREKAAIWGPGGSYYDKKFERENILVVGLENGEIKFFDVRDWSCKQTLKGHKKSVTHLKFHPTNSKILISGSDDGTVKLWRFGQGYHLYKKIEGSVYY